MRNLARLFNLALIYLLAFDLVFLPAMISVSAEPHIPGFYGTTANLVPPASNALPLPQNIVTGVESIEAGANNGLVIHQNDEKAVIDWQSFDIGANAWTHFDQQGNPNWAALNRIYDQNPSQIFGQLTADGRVYLINQNGMVFSPGANVEAHSLVASSLNINNQDFIDNSLKFYLDNYMNTTEGDISQSVVANHGSISTDNSGSVFLIGPNVENSGAITSPLGQIGLAAGEAVEIKPDDSEGTTRIALTVNVTAEPGTATNFESGQMVTETGLAGMYGRFVNQEGLIKSVTAIKRGSAIELFASEKITTGENSLTLNTVSASTEAAHESFNVSDGTIRLSGLDPDYPENPQVGARVIEHKGRIEAPSGDVRLEAEDRVLLENGSTIDVAGVWVDMPNSELLVDVQLNSVELRDTYAQKDGLLQGETIQVSKLEGSSIGRISESLTSEEMTALQRSAEGGTVNISATGGDVIVKSEAQIDFSGGGTVYADGTIETTKLVAGETIYDISDAPDTIQYDAILGTHVETNASFGQTETFEGIYYGGANTLKEYVTGHLQGADAGSAFLISRSIVLDGILIGQATAGDYQTSQTELTDLYGDTATSGRALPRGGLLEIGDSSTGQQETDDAVLENVIVQESASFLVDDFGVADENPYSDVDANGFLTSYLSAERLNSFDVQTLTIASNATIETETGAAIALTPGGSLTFQSRAIAHNGEIVIPGGDIVFKANDNLTSFEIVGSDENPNYVDMPEQIVLGNQSLLSVAGERVDNSDILPDGDETLTYGVIDGGSISLHDRNDFGDGVIVNAGARIDVSGGYEIFTDGDLMGGNAGDLNAQGNALILSGDLKGSALSGADGGRISLAAAEVIVVNAATEAVSSFALGDTLSDAQRDKLILSDQLLSETGFTQIELASRHDLTMESGALLTPSTYKDNPPLSGGTYTGSLVDNMGLNGAESASSNLDITLQPDAMGASSLSLTAGAKFIGVDSANVRPDLDATLAIGNNARIIAPLETSISLKAPSVDISGEINALAGNIDITAANHDLIIRADASISASGFAIPGYELVETGQVVRSELYAGGTIDLTSDFGSIGIADGAVIDLSGSASVSEYVVGDGERLVEVSSASSPGTLLLSYYDALEMEGELVLNQAFEPLTGATLTMGRLNPSETLTLLPDDLARYLTAGFDDITFQSLKGIEFVGGGTFQVERSLTLDAPEIIAVEGNEILLESAQVRLINTAEKYETGTYSYDYLVGEAAGGDAALSVEARWMDLEGQVALSGFETTRFDVEKDLILSDVEYSRQSSESPWAGALVASGDLEIDARTIYPTTASDFQIRTDGHFSSSASGETASEPVVSAGGSLTIQAAGIEHHGIIKAPMGAIQLTTTGEEGRIFLAEGSVLSTKGEAMVSYGELADAYWSLVDKETSAVEEITSVPLGDIGIDANQLIIQENATLDASAGGGISTHQFLPGIEGSENPFEVAGTFVIIPDEGPDLPGDAIYLTGEGGLPASFYKVLPDTYAYMDGAVVLRTVKENVLTRDLLQSEQGYEVVYGYDTENGVLLEQPNLTAYAVMPMSDALAQGHFEKMSFTAGQGGTIRLDADTAVVEGTLMAEVSGDGSESALLGGTLSLAAGEIVIGTTTVALPSDIDFSSPLDPSLIGKMNLDPAQISNRGFGQLNIGNQETTTRIQVDGGTLIEADNITLSASGEIALMPGSTVHATAPDGIVSLESPAGFVDIQTDALVHAGHGIELDMRNIQLQGDLITDNSDITLTGDCIYLVPEGYAQDDNAALFLTPDLWDNLGQFENVTLSSREGITFVGDVSLDVTEQLTLETPALLGLGTGGQAAASIVTQTLSLTNPTETTITDSLPDTIQLSVTAEDLIMGPGDLRLDGFDTIDLAGTNSVVFMGQGALATDADTTITAPRILTRSYTQTIAVESLVDVNSSGFEFQAADFNIDTGGGSLVLSRSQTPEEWTPSAADDGTLALTAASIDVNTDIAVGGGQLKLTTTTGSLTLDGANLMAQGGGNKSGGAIALTSGQDLIVSATSTLDVSAGEGASAGQVELTAVNGDLDASGNLLSGGSEDSSGELLVDAKDIVGFSDLLIKTAQGGFDSRIDLRLREGDLDIAAGDTITAGSVSLTSDQGSVNLHGRLIATGFEGAGDISVQAGDDVHLYDGSRISATGATQGDEAGRVRLSADTGWIRMDTGAEIDLSGQNGGAGGGLVLRALRTADSAQMVLQGTLTGASTVTAEAVAIYDGVTALAQSAAGGAVAQTAYIEDMVAEAQAYMAGAALDISQLDGIAEERVSLVPGIEVGSDDDLTVATDINLTGTVFGDDSLPGVLTLRAGGGLHLANDIIDAPRSIGALTPGAPPPAGTWDIVLSAGNNSTSGTGNLNMADNVLVYTENGEIWIDVSGDMLLGAAATQRQMIQYDMHYNLATYYGDIHAEIGGDLTIAGGAIQSALGDIDLEVGGLLTLGRANGYLGAIRTTGEAASGGDWSYFWTYAGGGDIAIQADAGITGGLSTRDAWDYDHYDWGDAAFGQHWGASYGSIGADVYATEGIATMAGGDLTITTAGDVKTQAGTFGAGDLTLVAGGDVDGRFQIRDGQGTITAGGNFGGKIDDPAIELFDADLALMAGGNIHIGTITNPTLVREGVSKQITYSQDTSVKLVAESGNVRFSGVDSVNSGGTPGISTHLVLPSGLEVHTGRDILFLSDFAMVPSQSGNLILAAAGDLDGTYTRGTGSNLRINQAVLNMSDMDPDLVFGETIANTTIANLFQPQMHASDPVHAGDDAFISITAGGNIEDIHFGLPKQAVITAGGDIRNISYIGQNLTTDDVSVIQAGNDIFFSSDPAIAENIGIEHGGPGSILVRAGNTIDLGTSKGIQATGSAFNTALDSDGTQLSVIAGYQFEASSGEIGDFFDLVRDTGTEFSEMLARGEVEEAQQMVAVVKEQSIDPFLGDGNAEGGDINMINSQISMISEASDVYIFTSGELNVGRTTLENEGDAVENTGIYTEAGGNINVFSDGDINVNESRVMTFRGGDITMWSDEGNINAGRGSKLTVSTPEVEVTVNEDGSTTRTFKPPAVGSGIRTLTYDPDGEEGPREAPNAGDLFLSAPTGIIDAGEAGIAGRNVTLGAIEVVNAQNIDVSGVSVGVPDTSAATSIVALAGSGTVSETSKVAEASGAMKSAQERFSEYVTELSDDLVPKWLAVEVIGFEEDEDEQETE